MAPAARSAAGQVARALAGGAGADRLAVLVAEASQVERVLGVLDPAGPGAPLRSTPRRNSDVEPGAEPAGRRDLLRPLPVAGSKKWLAASSAGESATTLPATSQPRACMRPRASGT